MQIFSVEHLVRRSYDLALGGLVPLAPVWLPWLGILAGLHGVLFLLGGGNGGDNGLRAGRDALSAVIMMISILFSLGMGVAWYRTLLQQRWPGGPLSIVIDPALPTYALRLLAVVIAAIFGLIGIGLLTLLAAATLGTVLHNIIEALGMSRLADYPGRALIVLSMLAAFLGGLYVFSRCAPWLAAGAIGKNEVELGEVWRGTVAQAKPITWGLVLIYVPLMVFELGFSALTLWLEGELGGSLMGSDWAPLGFLLSVLSLLVSLFTTLVSVTYIALIFDTFFGKKHRLKAV